MANHYSVTLRFVRVFTTGTLVGLTHDDSIGFCSEADALDWVKAIQAGNAAGRLNYRIESFHVGR